MSDLSKEVGVLREQIKAKLNNFVSKPFLPFAMEAVDFIEKLVLKLEDNERRLQLLEQQQIGSIRKYE